MKKLNKALRGLPRFERELVLLRCEESISSAIAGGMTEGAAVASLGTPDEYAEGVLREAAENGIRIKKRSPVLTALIAAVCAISGLCALLAAAYALLVHVFSFDIASKFDLGPWTQKQLEFAASEITELEADIQDYDIVIGASSDGKVHVLYYESEKCLFSAETNDGLLRVEQTLAPGLKTRLARLFRHGKQARILLPSSFSGDISVICTAGVIRLEGLSGLGSVKVSLTSGEAKLHSIEAVDVEVSYETGQVELNEISLSGTLSLSGRTGSSELRSSSCDELLLDLTTGTMKVSDMTSRVSKLTVTTGSLDFSGFDSQDISISVATGSVNGKLKGRMDDYFIDCGTETGNCNMPSQYAGGPRRLYGRCATGRIHIYFENEERGQETEVPEWF